MMVIEITDVIPVENLKDQLKRIAHHIGTLNKTVNLETFRKD